MLLSLLLLASGAISDVTVPTPGGNLVFRDIAVCSRWTESAPLSSSFHAKIEINTGQAWVSMLFHFRLKGGVRAEESDFR